MASNFLFLGDHWSFLLEDVREAELMALRFPRTTAFYSRRALELGVRWVYDNDPNVGEPYDDNLKSLIHEPTFQRQLRIGLWDHIKYVWKLGNRAAHENRKITPQESVEALRSLHNFLSWLAATYTPGGVTIPRFDPAVIPDPRKLKEAQQQKADRTKEQIQLLEASLREKDEAKAAHENELRRSAAEIETLKAEILRIKAENEASVQFLTFSEAENRSHLIDPLLREAGWNPESTNVREFPVTGMGEERKNGRVDYVLWGNDGLPLAVVEAKKTQISPEAGKHQAKLYADCLEEMKGQRPLIYFTNGYKAWFWDDSTYPPRLVQGFHTRDELQLIVNRRKSLGDITRATINRAIVERDYQVLGIRKLADRMQREKGRGALLVMATGTGKTRLSIATVDMLMKENWVRRVLFLADRKALLIQAEREFRKHLPEVSRGSLLSGEAAESSRVMFSTYPTTMNLIDKFKEDGTRRFTQGHFDLIIIDEAHRSIYQKYKAIFEYFDSLILGLTATPRNEIDHNTYELFGLESDVPTHAYELDEAVAQGFLVPPKTYSVPVKFLREGIRYSNLSEKDKEQFEDKMGIQGDEDQDYDIDPAALNTWLFNKNTVDKVLLTLMESGIKVEGGDRLGKTIIFAKNHRHAQFIVERFDIGYPHLKGHFCQLIDNQVAQAQDLIDKFSVKEREPTIAVSVDMLDTGIDVPEVVNLVFFKRVYSKTKFWQMIGRGTRLCKDHFGPGKDKTHFAVFDFCMNLEFFGANPKGVEGRTARPVKEQIFNARLDLLEATAAEAADRKVVREATAGYADGTYRKSLLDDLHSVVAEFNLKSFLVRPSRREIEPFRKRDRWESLTDEDIQTLRVKIAPIKTLDDSNELARRFDLLMLKLQLAVLMTSERQIALSDKVKEISQNLLEKTAIPEVAKQAELLQELLSDAFWADITLPMLESVRKRVRGLVKFADRGGAREIVYVDFEDEVGEILEIPILSTDPSLSLYRDKVRHLLKDHITHPAVQKVRGNQPLTTQDVEDIEKILFEGSGVKADTLQRIIGDEGPLPKFVRRTVGLDKATARAAFNEIFEEANLNAKQMLFLNLLIDYLAINGVMDPGQLFEPPFTDQHSQGVDGVLPDQATRILAIIEQINDTVK